MSRIGNYNKALESKFDNKRMIDLLEGKLSKTEDPKLKNAIKLRLKKLKSNQTIYKNGN